MKTKFKFLFIFAAFTLNGIAQSYNVNDKVSIESKGKWYPGKIIETKADQYKIHYDNYGNEWDEWVKTDRLKGSASIANASGEANANNKFNHGDVVLFLNGGEWIEGDIASELSAAGRYQVHYGTSGYTYVYPKDMKPTNKPNVNIAKAKEAEQKKKNDEAQAKKDAEDAVGVIEGDQYKQFMADVDFSKEAVGQLCYYLDNAPSSAPGFDATQLSQTMNTLAKLDKLIKEKYPNAKSAKYVSRFNSAYTQQPGLFREVAEQRTTLAKRALEYQINRDLEGVWTFEDEIKNLKKYDDVRGTMLCKDYLEYAYMPGSFEKVKNNFRQKYSNAYKAAGLEFKDEEVFAKLIKQNAEIKTVVEENISQYSLAKYKAIASHHAADAEAVALGALKTDRPGATAVYVGCTTDWVISYDNNWAPPKNLGKGLGLVILAKVPGVPYLVAYSCTIDKAYKGGGAYGPAYLTNNGFFFWGLVDNK